MRYYLPNIIIGIAIIFTAAILGSAIKNRNKTNDVISVTGLGKKDFVSDLIVWKGTFTKQSTDLKGAYAALNQDRKLIKDYLLEKGLKASDMVFSSVNISNRYQEYYDRDGNRHESFAGYLLTQNVEIESGEINKIENISREVTELINMGVEFYSQEPQYYYTKLEELKIEMVAEATKDGRVRAEKIAENAKADLGSLKSAGMGVFQIVAENSNEDYSWGGAFNTSSKEKTATITMKLEFEID